MRKLGPTLGVAGRHNLRRAMFGNLYQFAVAALLGKNVAVEHNGVCAVGLFRNDSTQLLLEDASHLCHPIAAKPVPSNIRVIGSGVVANPRVKYTPNLCRSERSLAR